MVNSGCFAHERTGTDALGWNVNPTSSVTLTARFLPSQEPPDHSFGHEPVEDSQANWSRKRLAPRGLR